MAGSSIGIKFERFEHKWTGYRAILTSGEVQDLLQGKADRVRRAIESAEAIQEPWEVVASARIGRSRARVMVSGVPLWIEKRHGILGSAIDAGRG